jgi:CDP-glucose 4,6-dehydratase
MEVMDLKFWNSKKVLITGASGFKGAWLTIWLTGLGAKVTGYSLQPPTEPNLFRLANVLDLKNNTTFIGDIRNLIFLKQALADNEIVIHMAAHAIVRESYAEPTHTLETNIMGTVNILEACRHSKHVKSIIIVTTDKVYENLEQTKGYTEKDRLGGHDPYSSSKACAELVTKSYREAFNLPVATARAGNVIGGGDFAKDRIIPDLIRAVQKNETVIIRNPDSVRPWQHVLEPLSGYMLLAQRLYESTEYAQAWNFGASIDDSISVSYIVDKFSKQLKAKYEIKIDNTLKETKYLKLDSFKSRIQLGWTSKWCIELALQKTIDWYKVYLEGDNLYELCLKQIEDYERD